MINSTPLFTEIKGLPQNNMVMLPECCILPSSTSSIFCRTATNAEHNCRTWHSPVGPVLSNLTVSRSATLAKLLFFFLFAVSPVFARLLYTTRWRLGLSSMKLHNADTTDTEFGWSLTKENKAISNLLQIRNSYCTYPPVQHDKETNWEVLLAYFFTTAFRCIFSASE